MRTLLLLATFAVACGAQSTAPRFGEKVTMRFNATVRIPSDTTTVHFTDVRSDSRCPSGAQCVWSGDAEVVFTVGGAQQVTLHTTVGASGVLVAGRLLTLLDLAPYPSVSTSKPKSDYVATIRFDSARD
jgi:hypothetical protein